jgi:hypothetical protein
MGVMTKLSPQNPSCNDGMWFLASAYGQYAGLLGAIAKASENTNEFEKINGLRWI